MSDLTIRRANQADLAGIVALLADDALGRSREDPSLPLDRRYAEAFASIEADPNQLLAVADRAGQIAACLQLTFIPGLSRRGLWRGQIESVRVASGARGEGLGE
jgi:ribosomal protein S18 acetylase RimI-like enzyme